MNTLNWKIFRENSIQCNLVIRARYDDFTKVLQKRKKNLFWFGWQHWNKQSSAKLQFAFRKKRYEIKTAFGFNADYVHDSVTNSTHFRSFIFGYFLCNFASWISQLSEWLLHMYEHVITLFLQTFLNESW